MRRTIALCTLLVLATGDHAQARHLSRSYLAITGGVGGLIADVGGDIVQGRTSGRFELGIGYQLGKTTLLEFTYGWMGTWQPDDLIGPLMPDEGFPADTERAFRVGANPLMLRMRWARSGVRTEYLKPELSVGLGWVHVSRLLRNPPGIPPEETSQMIAACELGASALFVFTRDFSTSVGLRYTITERRGVVEEIGALDSVAFILAFRTFLPSPRDQP
jgi:hypothetical protein